MEKQQAFIEAIQKKFPKVADELANFVTNPTEFDPALTRVKTGVKFGFPYYITHAYRQDPTTFHHMMPSFITTQIAHILMTTTEYAFFTKRKDIEGAPLQVMLPPDGHSHIMVAFGFNYREEEEYPFSLMRYTRKFTRIARKKLINEGL